jgi:hypothetical protein
VTPAEVAVFEKYQGKPVEEVRGLLKSYVHPDGCELLEYEQDEVIWHLFPETAPDCTADQFQDLIGCIEDGTEPDFLATERDIQMAKAALEAEGCTPAKPKTRRPEEFEGPLPVPERDGPDVWVALDEYPGYVFNQDGAPMNVLKRQGSPLGSVMRLTYRWRKVGGKSFFVIGYRLRIDGKRKWAALYNILLKRNKAIREAKKEDYMDRKAQEMAAALRRLSG